MGVQNLADWHLLLSHQVMIVLLSTVGHQILPSLVLHVDQVMVLGVFGFPFSFVLIKKRQKSISYRTFNFRFLLFFHGKMNFLSYQILVSLSLFVIVCSIGSLGKNGAFDTVEEVHVRNCTFKGTQNAARIKTWLVKEGNDNLITSIIYYQIFNVINEGFFFFWFLLFTIVGWKRVCQEDLL